MDIINVEDIIHIEKIKSICEKYELSYKEITDLIFVLLNVYQFPTYKINIGKISINLEKSHNHKTILISINYNTKFVNIYFNDNFIIKISIVGCLPYIINFIDAKWPNLRQIIPEIKIVSNDNY